MVNGKIDDYQNLYKKMNDNARFTKATIPYHLNTQGAQGQSQGGNLQSLHGGMHTLYNLSLEDSINSHRDGTNQVSGIGAPFRYK